MAIDAKSAHREARTKIRTRIVAALQKEFGLENSPGLQIEFCNQVDTYLSLPSNFPKDELSDERIFSALQKEFDFVFERGSFIRFAEDAQVADVWLLIPPDFLKGELSNEENLAIVGWSIMLRWAIFPGKFLQEVELGELILIGFGIFPAKLF